MNKEDNLKKWYYERQDEETLAEIEKKSFEKKVKNMGETIDKLGHEKVWDTIESLSDYKNRVEHRKIFFGAGGLIPVKDGNND